MTIRATDDDQVVEIIIGSASCRLRTLEDRDVQAVPPLEARRGPSAREPDIPRAIRRAKDGDVQLAVAVIIPGHRHVAPAPPLEARSGPRARVPDIPDAIGRTKDRDVGLAVAVIVTGHGDVVPVSPLEACR